MSDLLYDALMLGRNKQVANEEYLVATEKKQAASFTIEERSVNISNVISDGVFYMHLLQDGPGYMEIEVLCDDNFIVFDKKIITSEEFSNGRFAFSFMVISDRLHNGRNYTSVTFRTSNQNIEIPVNIDNKIRVQISDVNPRERYILLESLYLKLKTGRIDQRQWVQESLELLNDIPGGDEKSLYLMLDKAHVYITGNDNIHAKNYIEHVSLQIPKLEKKNYDLYCYFIYLASLYEEVDGVVNAATPYVIWPEDTESQGREYGRAAYLGAQNVMDMTALQKVKWVYSHYPSWRILWILFYMDPELRGNYRLKLGELQELFYNNGFSSPVMYMEALNVYLGRPGTMEQVDLFELHVLNFAMKYECLTREVADRAAELILMGSTGRFDAADVKLAARIFTYAYDRFSGGNILRALCFMLIAEDVRDTEHHKYFERAVKAGFEDPEIYDYFIYSIDQSVMDPVPENVMKYFLDHTETLYRYKSYMFANIVSNVYAEAECYRISRDMIIKYAEYQMAMGQNDECLAIIYRDILEKNLLTPGMKNNLFDVISTKEIICSNSRMRSVLVFHNELQVYQESVLKNGRAFIKAYTTDALILFKDATGNIYHNIDYQARQLVESRKYIDLCIRDVPVNKYMLMGDTLPLLRAYKSPLEILRFFTTNQFSGQFRKEYEQELLKNLVLYYSRNSRDEQVYDELLKFRDFELSSDTRARLIEIMIKRGNTDDAYDEIKEYGPCGISEKSQAELADQLIRMYGDTPDELILMLCENGFSAASYDEAVFDYLYRFYNGDMDVLLDIYRSCNAYKRPAQIIEERILNRASSTGEHPEIVSAIFARYFEEGEDKGLMHRYMAFRCRAYLYDIMKRGRKNEGMKDLGFFDCLERDMITGYFFEDECIIAYLLHRIGTQITEEKQLRNIESKLKDLVRRGKMLEEFKYYRKYFEIPSTLANNIIISAFSEDPVNKPCISYEITGPGDTVRGVEEMEEIFSCCFVKYFTLFYGEKVVFSMDGQANTEMRYSDMQIQHDGSRYAALDDIIRFKEQNDLKAYKQALKDFYIKEKLIETLF